jgi:glycosyltransferase involved in cell wall biosynthesis
MMALSVAIDAFRLVAEPLTSGAIYVAELARSLSGLPEIQKLFLLLPREPGHDFIYKSLIALDNIEIICPKYNVFPERNFHSELYWIQLIIPSLLRPRVRSIDYYIAPYHHPPIFLPKKIRTITVIHDVCGLRPDCGSSKTKKGFYHHLLRFLVASIRSNLFITISEYTKKRFEKSFPFLSPRLSKVVYNGTNCKLVTDVTVNEILQKFGLYRKSYFLGFGAPGLRKGLDLMLGAYKLYKIREGQASLVLVVAAQFQGNVQQLMHEQGLKDVVIVSDIEAIERDALYRGALALLFPSRCEGFGYPVIEAMCQGCPPIAWKEGPAFEIVDSCCPLLNKLDIAEILDRMLDFEGLDCDSRLELAERLIKRSQLFTADKFGRDFLEAMTGLSASK